MGIEQDTVVGKLKEAGKYQRICPETLEGIVAWAIDASRSGREAVKRAKQKLHQASCGFIEDADLDTLRGIVQSIPGGDLCGPAMRPKLRQIMAMQRSTRERLGILDAFYEQIFEWVGCPQTILDVGCGLHPAAIAWMRTEALNRYVAVDIDGGVISILQELFAGCPVQVELRCQDVLLSPPREEFDLLFLLKTVPTLNRRRKSAGFQLLETLSFRHAVVSFPTHSFGGRRRNMRKHYSSMMDSFLQGFSGSCKQLDFDEELVFLLAP